MSKSVICVGIGVPTALVRAAGLTPVRLQGMPGLQPEFLEPSLPDWLAAQAREIVACEPTAVVIASDNELLTRLYFYLSEWLRLCGRPAGGLLHLVDFVYAPRPASLDHNHHELKELASRLAGVSGTPVSDTAFDAELRRQEELRAAAREVSAARSLPGASVDTGAFLRAVGQLDTIESDGPLRSLVGKVPGGRRPGRRVYTGGTSDLLPQLADLMDKLGGRPVGEDSSADALTDSPGVMTGVDPWARAAAAVRDAGPGSWAWQDPVTRAGRTARRAVAAGAEAVLLVRSADDPLSQWDFPLQRRELEAAGLPYATVDVSSRSAQVDDRATAAIRELLAAPEPQGVGRS